MDKHRGQREAYRRGGSKYKILCRRQSIEEAALFLWAFLAATIFPLSSEAAFVGALGAGMDKGSALFFASAGNISAITLNYFLGYLLYEKTKSSLLSSRIGKKAYMYGHDHGYIALLLSPFPIIGDPITLVAGMLRLRFFVFVLMAGGLRVARYYLLTLLV